MINSEILIGLPGYQITGIERAGGEIRILARYAEARKCPHWQSEKLASKDRYSRRVRHEDWGERQCVLVLEGHKWQCRECGRYFRERFPGILPCQRASEAFRHRIFQQHLDGINRSRLLRFPQLPKLQTSSQGIMWLIFLGRGFAPIVGVEPEKVGRGEWIRTTDLLVPNQAL